MLHGRVFVAIWAVLMGVALPALASDDAEADFRALFGADLKRVAGTAAVGDDVELAKLMMKAVDSTAGRTALKVLLLRKAAELGAKDDSGFEIVQRAVDLLRGLAPDRLEEWTQLPLEASRRRYKAAARGEAKLDAAGLYLRRLVEAGDAKLSAGKAEQALRYYRTALATASSVRSPVGRLVMARIKSVNDARAAEQRRTGLDRRLKANPADVHAREGLILHHLLVRDDPPEAAKLLSDHVGEPLRTHVPMATRAVEDLPMQRWLELGAWYESLAAKAATPKAKRTALRRAKGYYERCVAHREKGDMALIKGKLGLERIAKATASDRILVLDLRMGVKMELVRIPAGSFMRGPHKVTITKPFHMGVTEVTQAQYAAMMGKNPSHFKGAKRPMGRASWHDAVEFCRRLSRDTLRTVRLPTEAEWEYACRAGTRTTYFFGDDPAKLAEYAWWRDNSPRGSHDVGLKKPSPWGLYDMYGNVWEWCRDWSGAELNESLVDPTGPRKGTVRVVRGGSWHGYRHECQSSSRNSNTPDRNVVDVGFRVVVGEPIKDKPPRPRTATPLRPRRTRGPKVVLRAADAILHGRRIFKEKRHGKKMSIGRWLLPSDWVSWNVSFPRAGTYEVVARLAALKEANFRVQVGATSLTARSCATADYGTFQTVSLGTIRLHIAGRKTVEVRAVPEGWQPMNIAFLEFRHRR